MTNLAFQLRDLSESEMDSTKDKESSSETRFLPPRQKEIGRRTEDEERVRPLAQSLQITQAPQNKEKPLVDLLPFPAPQRSLLTRFLALQKWEGVVEEKNGDFFSARLVDLAGQKRDEYAEFSYDEVSREDLSLLEPGSVFYWTIGYYIAWGGQRQRSSQIRFRRLPAWTKPELERSAARSKEMMSYFEKLR